MSEMRELTPEEVAAMWLYGREYSRQSLGIIEWYARQDAGRKGTVQRFVAEMRAAIERTPTALAAR
jgi:hypothetical protein